MECCHDCGPKALCLQRQPKKRSRQQPPQHLLGDSEFKTRISCGRYVEAIMFDLSCIFYWRTSVLLTFGTKKKRWMLHKNSRSQRLWLYLVNVGNWMLSMKCTILSHWHRGRTLVELEKVLGRTRLPGLPVPRGISKWTSSALKWDQHPRVVYYGLLMSGKNSKRNVSLLTYCAYTTAYEHFSDIALIICNFKKNPYKGKTYMEILETFTAWLVCCGLFYASPYEAIERREERPWGQRYH